MTKSHRIHLLPKLHTDPITWTRLITAQKAFRLHALQTSPESFSSTYAREAAFTDSEWEARLQNPLALTLVAVQCPSAETTEEVENLDQVKDCIEGAWEGTAVLFGPTLDLRQVSMYEVFGLFVVASARGKGVGSRLIEVAVAQAVALAAGGEVIVRVRAAATNAKVVGLYEKAGFEVVQGDGAEKGEVVMEMRRGE